MKYCLTNKNKNCILCSLPNDWIKWLHFFFVSFCLLFWWTQNDLSYRKFQPRDWRKPFKQTMSWR